MYKHILIPISFDQERDSSGAIELAKTLASPDSQITLLHVVEHIPGYAVSYLPADYLAEARQAIQKEMDETAAALPNARAVVIEGHSGRSILDWAGENHPDLIIIASHRPGMQDLLLGSTAAKVVRHAQCAVHVLR